MKNKMMGFIGFIVAIVLIGNFYYLNNFRSYIASFNLKDTVKKIEDLEKKNNDLNKKIESLEASVGSSEKSYKDGEYTGEAKGFKSTIKVKVNVKDSKISDVKVISHDDTPSYANKPVEEIPKLIVDKQSTNVDVVSGATITSNGIKDAVNNALK
ncbi:FMN-binding domain-containing protein [Gottschalkia purinilytica]|uniref:FMN-binding domain-containing protein n=1 Tax=Gottschalkia purinilytica TaxID=1503 RepID=A0A0L0WA55_GOTPU|nr:FMN-binding protein [Gottschalkia purinilytica]KNF08346.1 FMN-binding domain-containing protein [Gottschalkia purinilytica]